MILTEEDIRLRREIEELFILIALKEREKREQKKMGVDKMKIMLSLMMRFKELILKIKFYFK